MIFGEVGGRQSGVARITQFDASVLPCQIAGEVKGFEPRNYLDAKEARRMSRCARLSWPPLRKPCRTPDSPAFCRSGASRRRLGTASRSRENREALEVQRQRGYDKLNPFLLPAMLGQSARPSCQQSLSSARPLNTVVTACAAERKPSARPPS